MKKSFIIAFGVALVAFVWVVSGQFEGSSNELQIASGTQAPDSENLIQVRTRRSTARNHESSVVLFGRTEGVRSVQVKVETSGRIVAVPGVKGQIVNKGDVIARIAMDDRQARLNEAKAIVERYAIAFEAAQKLSKKQFRSKVQLSAANADLETAKASLRSITIDIDRTTIRAPFKGVLDDVVVDIGDFVAVGTVSAIVVDLDPILIVGEVTERAANHLKLGDIATVTPVGSDPRQGIVTYISKVGSPSTRTFRVEVSLANPDGVISEGVTSELKLEQGRIKAHFVTPAVLTLNDRGELGVKVLDTGSVVQFHKVTIVDDTPEGIWLTGLPQDADLIVVGQEFVRSGQKAQGIKITGDQAS
ncbi:MAG: efflux RND transporter periplasmic adaptor subunit [Rhodospirillaceae bacterium]|nr:efflux RND transporter periplasmic adaptor subunit [Rhodospirillaceae bacterium]MBL6929927.1 efflux RND transporter periplasmic adaptor subunit [Rhodospirillales bacterium]MBL6942071.1 efflux RND transporter periplasmic adaptor subunit [Rhodospirillales bacterium]